MSATAETIQRAKPRPELHSGDKMTQPEFHRIYSQMDESVRAELIGGIVYKASLLKLPHGQHHTFLAMLTSFYCGETLGTDTGDSVTTILGDESEPQPDLFVRILPEYGGRSRTTEDNYIEDAPELWIHEAAVCQRDHATGVAALQAGLKSDAHAAFVAELASRRK